MESSIKQLEAIKKINPGYTTTMDIYIKDIREGKDPSTEPAQK